MRQNLYKWGASIAVLLGASFLAPEISSVAAEDKNTDVINEDYEDEVSLQPVAPAFNVDSLLDWSPDKDPDAELNRSNVPLNKDRFKGSKVNPLANKEAGVTAASITLPDHDTSSSVGSDDFNIYAFDNWQLLDSYIYWPGSENEQGIFSLPSPDIVDAAHRNGVPVYASLGFPWGEGDRETLEEIESFTQQADDGSFPVADKMIEAAEYYGFDGYFYNQETSGVSEETAKQMNDMMRYIKKKSDLHINWYDAQANDGSVSYQNAVNEQNDRYVKPTKDGIYSVDEMFLNYDWGNDEIDKTVDTMKKHDRNPFDAYAGFELQQNAYHTDVDTNALLDDNDQSRTSIALYTPDSTMGLAEDPADFHEKEKGLWTGPQGDPTEADDSEDWKGMARFVADSSVISSKPFTTNFNSGHGKQYVVDGEQVSSKEWNNRSVQDIMPTWRWWIRNEGSKLEASYDFDKAYNGGNSLQFSGDLAEDSVNDMMLYSTKLPVEDKTKVRVVYQSKPGADVSLGVAYDEDYSEDKTKYYPLSGDEEGWNTVEIDLGADAGKTAYALSLKVNNSEELEDYKLNVGQIFVSDEKEPISKPENPEVDDKLLRTATEAEARLSWDEKEDARLYEIYQENKDGEQTLLGSTTNNHFYASDISRTDKNASEDNKTTLKIVPVNQGYDRGEPAEVSFDWGVDTDATERDEDQTSANLALHSDVTDVSSENSTEPATAALDGSNSTKWAATDEDEGSMTIDLGEKETVKRWRVEHAESGGEEKDMNTKDFELLYKDKHDDWTTAKEITDNEDAVTDVILDEPVEAREFKLKIHDSGSSPWEAIRINEWQMFESDVQPKTDNIMMHFVSAENNPGATDKVTMENVTKGQTVRLYQSLKTDGVLEEKEADEDGKMTFKKLDFGPESGRIYYTVQDEDMKESLRFSTAYGKELKLTDLEESVEHFYEADAFANAETFHDLKMHLTAVTHYADQDKTGKVVKHLNGFKKLLNHMQKNHEMSEKAYQSLKKDTDKLIQTFNEKNQK